jgi:multicomponent Na+:H+ antiporter subunit A
VRGTGGRSTILDVTVRTVFPAAVVLSLYFLFAGHNRPGGGFVGGLVLGAAIALRFVAGAMPEVRSLMPLRPHWLLGGGLVLAATTAIVPLLFGDALLESAKKVWDVPLLGPVPVVTPLFFDTGVYLVVVGLTLFVLEAFGDDEPGLGDSPLRVRDADDIAAGLDEGDAPLEAGTTPLGRPAGAPEDRP